MTCSFYCPSSSLIHSPIKLLHKFLFVLLLWSWRRHVCTEVFKLCHLWRRQTLVVHIKQGRLLSCREGFKSTVKVNICCSHRLELPCAACCSWFAGRWCRCHKQTADQRSNQIPKKRQLRIRFAIINSLVKVLEKAEAARLSKPHNCGASQTRGWFLCCIVLTHEREAAQPT